jgi:hypothetical protein
MNAPATKPPVDKFRRVLLWVSCVVLACSLPVLIAPLIVPSPQSKTTLSVTPTDAEEPKDGTKLPLPIAPEGKPVLIAILGGCPCTPERVARMASEVPYEAWTFVAILSEEDPEAREIAHRLAEVAPRARVLFQRNFEWGQKLQASFTPRLYLLQEDGTLLWAERSPFSNMLKAIQDVKLWARQNGMLKESGGTDREIAERDRQRN